MFQVLDPAEVDFPFDTPHSFEDLETGERIPVTPEEMRQDYLGRMEGHVAELARRLTEQSVDHELVITSTPLDAALFRYLSIFAGASLAAEASAARRSRFCFSTILATSAKSCLAS